jgi:hypothetical protein
LRLPRPLSNLPWDIAQAELGHKGADFIGTMGALLLHAAKDQFRRQIFDSSRDPGALPLISNKDQFQAQLVDSALDPGPLPQIAAKDQIRLSP